MKKALLLLAVITIIPFLISQRLPRNAEKSFVEGEIMVKLYSGEKQKQQFRLQRIMSDFQPAGLKVVEKLSERLDIYLLSFDPAKADEEKMLEHIKQHPDVELAQFNHFIELRELLPNDPNFGQQWNFQNLGQTQGVVDADIDATDGWELGTSGVTATGDTIIIAVVDDGFDLTHEDLNFWKNWHEIPGNGIDDDTNGYIDDYNGWNAFTNNSTIPSADHGSHVTGIAAAKGNNNKGVTGVNWNVKVLPVKGSSTSEYIAVKAYAYVLEMRSLYNETGGQRGAFIVATNSSFGADGQIENFPIWGMMYDSLGMTGILNAGATKNANLNIDVVSDIPTAFPSEFLITVTNTTDEDVKNEYSGYGPTTIDLGAPGTAVYSTRWNNSYGNKTGTSMACPHVSGAIAYMFSVAGTGFMQAYHSDPAGMSMVLKQYILNGTDPLPSLAGITVTGGRLNIYNAARQMLEPELVFAPMSVLKVLLPNKQDSIDLQFTNSTGLPFTYAASYAETPFWTSLSGPLSGTLGSLGSASIRIHFNTTGMTEDTLFTYLNFEYNNGKQFHVPVHLFVQSMAVPNVTVNITADQETICPGETVHLTSHVTGGLGEYSFHWTSDPAGFTSQDSNITVNPDITTTYRLQIIDNSGKTGANSYQVNVNPLPGKPVISSGPATVDNYLVTSSIYTCDQVTDANSYVWYISPSSAGSILGGGLNGTVTWAPGFAGQVEITVVGLNDCGIGEFSDTFITQSYSSSGLEDHPGTESLAIYPNPAGEVLSVKGLVLSEGSDYYIFVYDLQGVQRLSPVKLNSNESQQINTGTLSPGIYNLVLKKGDKPVAYKKFLINN